MQAMHKNKSCIGFCDWISSSAAEAESAVVRPLWKHDCIFFCVNWFENQYGIHTHNAVLNISSCLELQYTTTTRPNRVQTSFSLISTVDYCGAVWRWNREMAGQHTFLWAEFFFCCCCRFHNHHVHRSIAWSTFHSRHRNYDGEKLFFLFKNRRESFASSQKKNTQPARKYNGKGRDNFGQLLLLGVPWPYQQLWTRSFRLCNLWESGVVREWVFHTSPTSSQTLPYLRVLATRNFASSNVTNVVDRPNHPQSPLLFYWPKVSIE